MKEKMENLVGEKESVVGIEQLERPTAIETKKEVVQDLRDVEFPNESQQPPEHIKIEEYEEANQEMNSIMEGFLFTFNFPSIGIIEECAQPPIPLVNNEEENKSQEIYQGENVGTVYIEIEEYEEVDQEMNLFINEFLSKVESPLIG
ncbi:uncharacterized protein DS421_3g86060 [Arachis hypogaea]|nr:uncharacterized protein DS421_3g86060 [Arachis hypogaea]